MKSIGLTSKFLITWLYIPLKRDDETAVAALTRVHAVIPQYNLGRYSSKFILKIIPQTKDKRHTVRRIVKTFHKGPSLVLLYLSFTSNHDKVNQLLKFKIDFNKSLK